MSRITIVTGTPGAGKTRFARQAAKADPRGLHLIADLFYGFPAHPIDPTLPESAAQNAAIIKALCRAAGSFAASGYAEFLDGIFGPWFLETIATELLALEAETPTDYVVLRADIDTALQRVASREDGADPASVRQMNEAFRDLGPFESHAIDTTTLSEVQVLVRVGELRASGVLALDLRALAQGPSS